MFLQVVMPLCAWSSIDDGLSVFPLYLEEPAPRGFAFAVIRDGDGYLWIADDVGLKRYDGYGIRNFNHSPDDPQSLGSNLIPSIYLDDKGVLWAGGSKLSRYHPETETFSNYDLSEGYRIWDMYRDARDILWLAGEGFGLRGFDIASKQIIHVALDDPQSRFIRALTPHGESSLWVASSSGLYLFNTETYAMEQYALPEEYEQGVNYFMGAVEDPFGQLWMASSLGVVVLDPKTREVKRYRNTDENPNVLVNNIVLSIALDSYGDIWIGTDKRGIQRFNRQRGQFEDFPAFSNEYSFPPGAVNSIFEDTEGSLWFAVSVYGVRRVSPHLEKFTAFRHREKIDDSLGFNNVLDLMEGSNGDIWIATDGGGLDRLNVATNQFDHFVHDPLNKQSLSSDSVLSLAEDLEGNIWIGTWGGGLNKLDPKSGQFEHLSQDRSKPPEESLAANNIFRIEVDDSGLLYLSVWQTGLQILDPKTGVFKSYLNTGSNPYGVTNFSINDILIDTELNKVWLGGQNGLELFDPKEETFDLVDLGEVYAIYDIYKQGPDLLWLATSTGLIKYQIATGRIQIFSEKEGLSDKFLVSIEEDQEGHLWLGSQNGLNHFDPQTQQFKTYKTGDGLASSGFNRFAHLTSSDGLMYFGGAEGVTAFNPDKLPVNTAAPKVHLTKFELYQSEVMPGDYTWFAKHINYLDALKLPYDQRDISFEFTALNFISPSDNRFRYRLLGLEERWVEVDSSRRRVRYTNLDPGKYQFQVLASNNDGVWSLDAKTIDVIVLPPWWQLWWMKMLFLLAGVGLIYLFIYWRLRSNLLRQKQLKFLVDKQTEELNILNLELEKRVEQRTSELSIEVEERRLAEAKLFHMAFHDQLTGLPNRSWLLQRLEELIVSCKQKTFDYALFFLDGDRFKQVNDTHGHRMGDKLLVSATERLQTVLADGQHVVRLGGDEFTILIERLAKVEDAESLAKNIIEAFEVPFVLEQNKVYFRVSIGVLICGDQYDKPSQLLRDADVAMYRAKEAGRGTYRIFDEKMRESTLETAQLEADLHSALTEQQFFLMYQPIIDISTNKIITFEALIRWHHPERGLIPPDKFIPIAEYLGFITQIGLWVLEEACWQWKRWSKVLSADQIPNISVNISSLQLGQLDFIQNVDAIFHKTGVSPSNIKMEITESVLAENTKPVVNILQALRARGVELLIDDFGTGYSSLGYLDQLPIQTLKIDRKFIASISDSSEENKSSREIVRATILLAHNLSLNVVAEGVETLEQLEKLAEFECDFAQGYFISRPLKAESSTDFILQYGKQKSA